MVGGGLAAGQRDAGRGRGQAQDELITRELVGRRAGQFEEDLEVPCRQHGRRGQGYALDPKVTTGSAKTGAANSAKRAIAGGNSLIRILLFFLPGASGLSGGSAAALFSDPSASGAPSEQFQQPSF
jgi:hypothetical protein